MLALGSLIVTNMLGKITTLISNIGLMSTAIKSLNKVIAGSWFAKLLTGGGAVIGSMVAFFASLGYAVNDFMDRI